MFSCSFEIIIVVTTCKLVTELVLMVFPQIFLDVFTEHLRSVSQNGRNCGWLVL